MRILGFEIRRQKAALAQAVDQSRGWWPIVRERFAGAWQRNAEPVTLETAVSNPVLFRCVSLIAGDISKMRCRLMSLTQDGIWVEAESPAFSPVLRKPNPYQTWSQFAAGWVISKLSTGNTVVLKERDNRGVVVGLHMLDWTRLQVLVAPDGSVFYQVKRDDLAGVDDARAAKVIPASEVIHDRWNTMFHPLIGLSPIYACGLAALQAQEIQQNSTRFFRNGSRPGGVLTAPNHIEDETAQRLKEYWDTNFTGDNAGKVAVLGDGLEYKAMAVTAEDAQLVEQLKWSGETVCGCFGVPPYMAGVGAPQLNNNVETLAQLYYAQCLQVHIEAIESCLDEGLGIGPGVKTNGQTYGVEFDLDDLLRMDSKTQIESLGTAVTKGLMKPDEGRRKLGLPKVAGGDAVYLQEQNYSLAALARRDAKEDPWLSANPAPKTAEAPAANDDEPTEMEAAKAVAAVWRGLRHVQR